MRQLLASVAVLGLAVVLVWGQPVGPKLEGTWLLSAAISNGAKVPDAVLLKSMGKMVVKDGTYEQSEMGVKIESGKFKIDATKNPATIDLDIITGDDKGKMQPGIFKLDGDKLTIAVGKAGGKDRPKDFAGGKGIEVTFFKRSK